VSDTRVDGRRARRDRNLEHVLDTARQLFAEEHLLPGFDELARRSGVSVRSLYRYFPDQDALVSAAIERSMRRGIELARIPGFGRGSFAERLDAFVDNRVALYEQRIAGYRAALHYAGTIPPLADALQQSRMFLRDQVATQFAPELDALPVGDRRLAEAACDTISQFEGIDHLRRTLRCTEGECRAVLRRTLARTLGPEP
jgi:AcrR family transcriptional regulator